MSEPRKTVGICGALVLVLFSSAGSFAQERRRLSVCELEWKDYVDLIKGVIYDQKISDESLVLFVGTDGYVFDCLNQVIENNSLYLFQHSQMMLARTIAVEYADFPDLAVNICAIGRGEIAGKAVGIISLPYEDSILTSPACSRKIKGLAKYFSGFLD